MVQGRAERLRAPAGAGLPFSNLVGLDRLNPQLQEQVIKVKVPRFKAPKANKAARFENGRPAPAGARNLSARPWTK